MVHDTFALAVEGLHKRYGSGAAAVDALVNVDLAFARGTFTAIMGPSGSGKSTFLACVAGLDRPTSGRIVLDGTDVTAWNETARTRMRRDRIGFVFQDFDGRVAGRMSKPTADAVAAQLAHLDQLAAVAR